MIVFLLKPAKTVYYSDLFTQKLINLTNRLPQFFSLEACTMVLLTCMAQLLIK